MNLCNQLFIQFWDDWLAPNSTIAFSIKNADKKAGDFSIF